jgi:hypothetical protein
MNAKLVYLTMLTLGACTDASTTESIEDEGTLDGEVAGAKPDPFFAPYPQDQLIALSTGRTVAFPLHLRNYDQLVLSGVADRALAQAELASTGLYVAPLTDLQGTVLSETLTSVSLFVITYRDTSLGSYHETIVTIPVVDATGRFGYYTLAMDVTSRFSRRVGREVLGLPKAMAEIRTQMPATDTWRFDTRGGADPLVKGSCEACGALPAFPLALDFEVATTSPITGELVWFRILNHTDHFSTRSFDPAIDAFELDPGTQIGQTLGRVGFAVSAQSPWMISRDVKGVTFAP